MRAKSFTSPAARCVAAVMLIGWLSVGAAAAESSAIPTDCNRACLEAVVNQYLAAVVAHDPKRLPLAADVKFTENDQVMNLGDGFWGTASAIGNYKHYFADPETGQAAFMGTMLENGSPALLALRLKIQFGKITEIETSLYRQGGGGPNDIVGLDKTGKPEPLWMEPIPAGQRATRQQLIATANAYFAGLENNDGKGYYPFTDDCNRIENGIATTNNPSLGGNRPGFNAMALGCKAQFESGYYAIVNRIHHRRFWLVDEERGVVWAYSIFDMNGTVHAIKLTNGEEVSMRAFSRPSSIEVTEAFRIENGKIRRVEMVGSSVPYHLNPGWPGGVSGH
jgi:hypothetical protein